MVAGRGTRISRHINNKPKCMVEIKEGQTLIKYTIELLLKKGINDIVIVTGYKSDLIKKHLSDFDLKFYDNPFFDVTNSIASLWFAAEELNNAEKVLLMNGDVFFEESLLLNILESKSHVNIFSDESRKEEADYKLYYKNEYLRSYGKEIEEITGEYIGVITLLGNKIIKEVHEKLEKIIFNQEHSLWWENAIFSMSKVHKLHVQDVKGKFWAEVDYMEDYLRILDFLKDK